MIIKSNRELKSHYDRLDAGDICMGTVSSKYLKKTVLLDLLERGVTCLPSALSQVLNSSKVAQAFILNQWMLPQTEVINRRMELIDAISRYNSHGIGTVITKQDHLHCGHGVRRWEDIEVLYNHIGLAETSYPFVLQPYVESFKDIRVIIVDTYIESYIRQNPYNFRMNISVGSKSHPYSLEPEQEQFCRSAMQRGKFPFAHLDVLMMESGEVFLSEISLNGGTKGARIGRNELNQKKQTLLEDMAQKRR
ncbi:MAG: hypothetical protein PVG70_12315 [Desulfobacterales bacterium]|jgi:ribosomal protein S6--L-glutamate ligase